MLDHWFTIFFCTFLRFWEKHLVSKLLQDTVCNLCERVGDCALDRWLYFFEKRVEVAVDGGVNSFAKNWITAEQILQIQFTTSYRDSGLKIGQFQIIFTVVSLWHLHLQFHQRLAICKVASHRPASSNLKKDYSSIHVVISCDSKIWQV